MPRIVRLTPQSSARRPSGERTVSHRPPGTLSRRRTSPRHRGSEGWYDIRRGAAGYAPIVATFGALAVPAIVVLFTVPPTPKASDVPLIGLAGGLLIVAVAVSFAGSIGMAAIGAEQDLTANLVPATMFLAVGVGIAIVAMLGAFDVLASIYLPESAASTKTLFAVIVGVGGLVASFFTGLSVIDTWHTGPSDPVERERWRQDTQKIKTQDAIYRLAATVTAVGAILPLVGIVMRVFGVKIALTTVDANWLVALPLVLSLAAIGAGAIRVRHPLDGSQKGLQPWEAFTTTLSISAYAFVLMVFLP
jgi:hypothetical protein